MLCVIMMSCVCGRSICWLVISFGCVMIVVSVVVWCRMCVL